MANVPDSSTAPTPSDLIAEYALGTLSADERAQVEALLANSAEARQELAEVQDMLGALAVLGSARKAPAHMTEDFRKRLAATPVQAPTPPRIVPPAGPSVTRRSFSPRWVLTLIAAVVIVAIAVLAVYRSSQVDPEQRERQQILTAANARRVELVAQGNSAATATLVYIPNSAKAVLVTTLPTLPDDKAYQLWLIRDKTPASARVFRSAGSAEVLITMSAPVSDYQVTAITVEPKDGSPGPTTAPIFAAPLSG